MSYFVIERARKVGNKMQIQGDMIVGATYEVPVAGSSSGSSEEDDRPQIDFPSPPEIKWILPPRNEFGHNNEAYDAVKGFAQSQGYETVEHDDFSYPAS